ncbi:MAG: DUF1028 domain-containing protein [Nitrososphaerales archaeon]|nr:DUF1028 domain-containing protein [Nitrososphaerales archaeon]
MTYSIVARDPKTGEMGVAVQSHYFSVGSVVTWARAGIGAVATQSMTEIRYGPLGLELMAAGKSAAEALRGLLAVDPKPDIRQVAMVDSKGRTAAHTGKRCIPYAGNTQGKSVSCQGNIMRNGRVWTAMRKSYEKNARLPLPERLVAALEAGEAAGGDARGKQSAAILVVSGEKTSSYWEGRVVELRVEDHPEPVPELKRLLRFKRGYDWVDKGDGYIASGKLAAALKAYERALELVPEVDEIKYWVGVSLLPTKRRERGLDLLKEVFAKDRSYVKMTKAIVKAGSLPIDPSVREAYP